MNSVAPCSADSRSPSVTATGMPTGTLLPRKLGDDRGRSVPSRGPVTPRAQNARNQKNLQS
jgi:hypothetical protein